LGWQAEGIPVVSKTDGKGNTMKEHFTLLGHKVKDYVTGFEGVVTSISFDLYGCVQAIVQPEKAPKIADLADARWFDTKRLKKLSAKPVMAIPTFETVPGGQALPRFPSNPLA
jgi:hypothetical protein